LSEAAITHSPHAYVPKEHMTQAERDELYRTRIDESFKPYTVIDVLTKVYHRSFSDDLLNYIGEHPEEFSTTPDGWNVARAWVNSLKIIRPESVFFQPSTDFQVDIFVETRIRLEEVRSGKSMLRNAYSFNMMLRLRYSFDLVPCHLDCRYVGVVTDESKSLQAMDEAHINVDKYLLPVLKGDEDYRRLARHLIYAYKLSCRDKDIPFDPIEWITAMRKKVRYGVFPENGVQGEYFFGFGTADLVDTRTGVVKKGAEINPGAIIVNHEIIDTEGARNTTITHEGVHSYLDYWYFMLQNCHGHQYCSYMCKRVNERQEGNGKWTPVEIMEVQANKLPGFLMIQDGPGKRHAADLLASYGGERSVENMRRLVADMADYYKTTKTVARTRLLDFGYTEVKGLLQTANGNLVPSYRSELPADETYTIDEVDGVREYVRNPEFRKIIDTGLYTYVEGHYCLDDPDFIRTDQFGFRHLTQYARVNMDKCCLAFKVVYQNTIIRVFNGIMRKNGGKARQDFHYIKKDGSSPVTEEGRKRLAAIRKQKADQALIEKTFNQMTVDLMDGRKINIVPLAEATGLSRDTIKNMRNDPRRLFPIQEVVAVAIALHLPPEVSREYIRHAPTNFLDTDEMFCYKYALNEWYQLSVAEVNRKLVEMGVPPLTKLVDGYDENGVQIDDRRAM